MSAKGRNWDYDNWSGYLFIGPWLLGFITITLVPMVLSLYYSATNYDLLSPAVFIGLRNYVNIFNDKKFYSALRVTLTFVIFAVPLRIIFALSIALLLNTRHSCLSFYRTVLYVPSLIGGSVAVAVMWRQLFSSFGPVVLVLNKLGISFQKSLVGSPETALGTIITLIVWQFGSAMLIFLAGLKNIPSAYYEVAEIDGANKYQQFAVITLPLLSPVLIFNICMSLINSFMIFTQGYIITEGGPMDRTLFLILYVFRKGFEHFYMGYASALSWLVLIILGIFLFLFFKYTRRWTYYEN